MFALSSPVLELTNEVLFSIIPFSPCFLRLRALLHFVLLAMAQLRAMEGAEELFEVKSDFGGRFWELHASFGTSSEVDFCKGDEGWF